MELKFDVFISYATGEGTEVGRKVCEHLEGVGLKCWIAPRNIMPGQSWDEAILDGIESSAMVLVLCDRRAEQSQYVKREVLLATDVRKPLMPVRLDEVELRSLRFLLISQQWFDASNGPIESYLENLTRDVSSILRDGETASPVPDAPHPMPPHEAAAPAPAAAPATGAAPQTGGAPQGKRTAILYRRNAEPDERLLRLIEGELRAKGANVFIDRHLAVGVEWAREIERQIRGADVVITLLSKDSAESEMMRYEINLAHEAAQEQGGRPRLLPIRIAYSDALPGEIARIVDPIEWFLWHGPQDDAALVESVIQGVFEPQKPTLEPPRSVAKTDGSVLPLSSQYYIERAVDRELASALNRRDSIVLLKGARQMGKTSLLARGLRQAREARYDVVATDFQKFSPEILQSAKDLYLELGNMIADQLDVDDLPEDSWNERRPPNVNFERYLRTKVLRERERHLVWAIDEADRLFPYRISSEVFGLFRSWHNDRALDPGGPWSGLTLIIAYATEAHLFIADLNVSPFNVGTRLTLTDFGLDEIRELNERYQRPIQEDRGLTRFHLLVGGQPFLTHRGLQELANGMSLADLERKADDDQGPFGDHLRRMLVMLAKDEAMFEAMREILEGRPCPNEEVFYRLRSGGLLLGSSARSAEIRCDIYAGYLKKHIQ